MLENECEALKLSRESECNMHASVCPWIIQLHQVALLALFIIC